MSRAFARALLAAVGCGSSGGTPVDAGPGTLGDGGLPLPTPACDPAAGGGGSTVAAPVLAATLFDRWHEGTATAPWRSWSA